MAKPDFYLNDAEIKNDILLYCQSKYLAGQRIQQSIQIWNGLYGKPQFISKSQPFIPPQVLRDKVDAYIKVIAEDEHLIVEDVTDYAYNPIADSFLDSGGYPAKYKKDKASENWRRANVKIGVIGKIIAIPSVAYSVIKVAIWIIDLISS